MLDARRSDLLEARGLDVELCAQHGLCNGPYGSDWITIPYYVGGEIVNRKHRTISGEKRFSQDENGKCVFWNSDVISDETLFSHPLIITEGEFDALAALQSGFPRVVSVPNGAPQNPLGELESGKYKYIVNAPVALRDCKEIILATDSDEPGIALRDDLALRLGRARCKFLQYPKECKDLCDALTRYDQRGVVETLQRAQWLAIQGVYKLSELPPLNLAQPYTSHFPGLDDHYRLRIGDFCVLTGAPGKGKTTFSREVAALMAQHHQWVTVMASFEAVPQLDHRRALRSFYTNKLQIYMHEDECRAADEWIDQYFRFIVPQEDDEITLDWLIERISAGAIRDHAKLVIIDPWNEIDHERPRDMSLTEYVGAALRRFKRMARTLGVHLIIAAHPAKLYRNREGKYPTPTLYDISDSAMWANRADVGIVVDRPTKDPDTIIEVVKSRFHDQIGTPGETSVVFDGIRYGLVS